MHAPFFWNDKTLRSTALLPVATLYGFAARLRTRYTAPHKISVPVICIGNVIAGGSGKTPVALALGALLKAQGKNVHYLSRGYKGKLPGPVRVDTAHHKAEDVGDEPLLLAEILPTWVSKNRVAGAQAAVAAGAELIIMDDGFQNPTLHKDISLVVIDGSYGFGNGRMLPAGPLRELPNQAFARTSAIILIGEGKDEILTAIPSALPIIRGRIEPLSSAHELKNTPVLAFAGIARPYKFHRTLQQIGARICKLVAYSDHYRFKPRDLESLRAQAQKLKARLVTTSKDYVRLPKEERHDITPIEVGVVFEDMTQLLTIVMAK